MGQGKSLALDALNRVDRSTFVATLGPVFENSEWLAGEAFRRRPFASIAALHAAIMDVVGNLDAAATLEFLRAHPELAGREALDGTMTEASTGEQGRLGLTRLTADEFARITRINAAYRTRFGFPCIVALRLHASRTGVLDAMERRLANTRDAEIAAAFEQIGHITKGRLERILGADEMGRLSTHVLDTSAGRPGAGMTIELDRLAAGAWQPVKIVTTTADGRTDGPLLEGEALVPGRYRLRFHVARYFAGRGLTLPDPPFLDVVPVEVGIADAALHYHVPLLCTPWSYATYRGS